MRRERLAGATARRRLALATAATCALALAGGLALTLASAKLHRAGTNDVPVIAAVDLLASGNRLCQDEQVPAGAAGLELTASHEGPSAPELAVTVLDAATGAPIAVGSVRSWSGRSASIALRPRIDRGRPATVCMQLATSGPGSRVIVFGGPAGDRESATENGRPIGNLIRIDFMEPAPRSWWSFAPTAATRIARAHAWRAEIALAVIPLVLVAALIAAWLRARVPRAALACALVATLNAVAWSIVTPPFQAPDEQAHYAYAEYLSQHGRPPVPREQDVYSPALTAVLRDLHFEVRSSAGAWSAAGAARLRADLERDVGGGNGAARGVGGEPPLYYALASLPYELGRGGTLLDQLTLMRLLSALLAGATALFTFLFLRELLPGRPWSWTVGALGVAVQPLFGFISGSVNSDALLYAASAAIFFLLARGFRRGLDTRLAVALGAATAVALQTKFNAIGLLPGIAFGLLALAIRREGRLRPETLRLPALALAIAAGPSLLELALNATVWDRPALGVSSSAFALHGDIHPTLPGGLAYAWQFYATSLPGMEAPLGRFPLTARWIDGFVGLFGWLDTHWSPRVYRVAHVVLAVPVVLACRALAQRRRVLLARRVELLTYAATAAIFALSVATASYIVHLRFGSDNAQARYLLPLLPLYGALLALATLGAGKRWRPLVAVVLVALAVAHDLFAQLLVIARFYA